MGRRTTLDILDAEQELNEARIALVNARRNHVVAEFSLAAALGLLTVESMPALGLDEDESLRRFHQPRIIGFFQ